MRAKDTVSAMKLLPERSSRIIRPRQLKPRGWIRIVEASYDVVLLVGCASLTRTLFAGQHISGRNLHDVSRTKGQKKNKAQLTHLFCCFVVGRGGGGGGGGVPDHRGEIMR